ncbi:hypothetical protein NDU88_006117 [Pleurodeles waltl]|uniref:Uncharacterized protein n=1 Tax=Pleurodeles waltl TaxID=8319 RepID=A0AAV7WWN2_PLEWA|nr:hypothetical protein NDU88_006117 [Pleurodeles waltl]
MVKGPLALYYQATQRLTRQTRDSLAQSPDRQEEPSGTTLPEAILGSQVALEGQITGVSVKVNLLRAGLRKVADKVSEAETNITTLQTELRQLKEQMARMTTAIAALEDRVEDAEWRSR